MSTEQIVQQFEQILEALKRIVSTSQSFEDRVNGLERSFTDTLGALTSIQSNLQMLLENYRSHSETQNKINKHLGDALAQLEMKVAMIQARVDLPTRETIQ